MAGEHAGVVVARRLRPELGREPRLADTRLAGDEDEVRASAGQRGCQRRVEHGELLVASDEWRARTLATLTGRRDGLDRDERLHRLLAALHCDHPERLVPDPARGGRVRGRADDDLSGSCDRLEAAGGVHHVAHCRVVATGAQRADEHLAGVHPNPHLELEPGFGAHLYEVLLHPECRPHRALGVVLVRDRRAEQRDERVADDLVDLPAEGGDVVGEPREAAVDEVLHLLRVGGLGEARVPDQVREQHGGDATLVRPGDERVSAAGAEPGIGRHRQATGRTGHGAMLRPGVTSVRPLIADVTCVRSPLFGEDCEPAVVTLE